MLRSPHQVRSIRCLFTRLNPHGSSIGHRGLPENQDGCATGLNGLAILIVSTVLTSAQDGVELEQSLADQPWLVAGRQ